MHTITDIIVLIACLLLAFGAGLGIFINALNEALESGTDFFQRVLYLIRFLGLLSACLAFLYLAHRILTNLLH